MSALAFARCAHVTGDANMKKQGLEMYQNGLTSIRNSLNQRNTTCSADTVMAISAMAVYEVSFPEVKYATHAHTL
jgi:hypothetical protein